ncbi:MAG: hypothetical protein HZB23_14585 [Deltaproteobacteria bacterium]|nr:hypothetical protein [Deltaproteobacteria bacterium]
MASDLGESDLAARGPDISEVRAHLMAMEPEKAHDAILDHPWATALVRSLASQDFYLLVKEIGPEDAIELLALASQEQWRHFLDVETWSRDRLDLSRMDYWLDILRQADPDRLVSFLENEEPEAFKFWLNKRAKIVALDEDEDPTDLPGDWFTLDGSMYLQTISDDTPETTAGTEPATDTATESESSGVDRDNLVRAILDRLAGSDYEIYRAFLFETNVVIPNETEEELFRLRNVRLAEQGFLPHHEAVAVYAHLSSRDMARFRKAGEPAKKAETPQPLPLLPGFTRTAGLFTDALARLNDPETLLAKEEEFAALCNLIASADQIRVNGRDDLAAVVRKACGYISMGIERLGGSAPEAASAHIGQYPLDALFRLGYSSVLDIRAKAVTWRKEAWFQRVGLPLDFWGETWLGHLGGLLLKKPLCFDNYQSGRLYREFDSLNDAKTAENALSKVMALDSFLSGWSVDQGFLKVPGLCWDAMILTVWARDFCGLAPEFARLTRSEFKDFFTNLWDASRPVQRVSLEAKKAFLEFCVKMSGWDEEKIRTGLGDVFDALFTELEEEYGAVAVSSLEPALVRHLWAMP